jgi:glycosyltransferase involved in cell wall biosynthesis
MSKVSVIVPVHNTEKYIEQCVSSLLQQTLSDIEILLVENGSTDGSLAECERLALTDQRIRVIHIEEGDVSVARNVGLREAVSEYIGFVDSDDTVSEDMYKSLYNLAEQHDLDIVYSNYVKVYENKPPRYLYANDGRFVVVDTQDLLRNHYLQRFPASACTMIARKRLFDNISFPEGRLYEDRSVTYQLLAASRRGGYLNKAFYSYYQREGSTVHSFTWKHYYDYCMAEGLRLKFLYETDLFDDSEKGKMAKLSASWLLRKLRHLRKLSQTPEQKAGFLQMKDFVKYIPSNCPLSFKMTVYKRFFKIFYR